MEDLEQRLERLRTNRVSGAMDLALEGLALARDWLAGGHPRGRLAAELRVMRPAIAPLANLARAIEQQEDLEQLRGRLEEGPSRIAKHLAQLIPPGSSIVTLSNSSTARAAIPALRPRRVVALQSLPGGEGETFAKLLRESHPEIEIAVESDAAMGRAAANSGCALIGVDSFDSQGALIHKTGTLPLALCCRHFGIPLYAAGHSFKQTAECLAGQPADPYFDLTPGSLITALVLETGPAS